MVFPFKLNLFIFSIIALLNPSANPLSLVKSISSKLNLICLTSPILMHLYNFHLKIY